MRESFRRSLKALFTFIGAGLIVTGYCILFKLLYDASPVVASLVFGIGFLWLALHAVMNGNSIEAGEEW